MNSEEENKDFIYVDGRKMFSHEDTEEIVATITFPDHPHIKEEVPLKIVGKINGFWIDQNDKQLSQSKDLNNTIFYGDKVKIKLMTTNVPDEREIDVEVKAKQEGKYIKLKTNTKTLKFTIKVKNNQAISKPFYLDPNWYNEEIERYNYKIHQTEINTKKALTFVFEAKFMDNNRVYELPIEDSDKLKPVTYRRNYEELIGLFNTNNNGEKDKEQNYENKFIKSNSEIENIVDEFIKKVSREDATISEIKTLVKEKATELWNAAVKQVQGGNLDDRPLYWARNKMQTWLKRNPLFKDQIDFDKSIVKKGTELDKMITLFEEKSRNYTGIDFSKAGNKKKVLITGFDPFLLNSFDHKYSRGFNILQSNPSGCVALNFHEKNIENSFVQTMIIPVRYTDFDNSQQNDQGQGLGVIERYIRNWVNQVDMIITISQSLPGDYNIDKFATVRRGGFNDNLDYTREDGSKALNTNDEWIETTLPKELTNAPYVEYNWEYDGIPNPKKTNPAKGQKLSQGSGGDYLSNEIFYRVAKLRKEKKPVLPTGHFHISKLQNENIRENFSNSKTGEMITIVRKGITEGIKGLKK